MSDLTERLRRELSEATSGPWCITHYAGGFDFSGPASIYKCGSSNEFGEPELIARPVSSVDAALIVSLRNHILTLIGVVDAAEGLIDSDDRPKHWFQLRDAVRTLQNGDNDG